VAASIVGVLGVLGPGFAENVLGLRPRDFVVIVLPLGVGVVVGALAVNLLQASVPRRRLIETGLVVLGVALVLIAVAGPLAQLVRDVDDRVPGPDVSGYVSVLTIVVAIAFVAGIAYAAVGIPAQTELQSEIPPAVRGRVFGILNMLVSVGSFVPIIIVGPISDAIGTMPVVVVSALVVLGVGVASIALRRGPAPVYDDEAATVIDADGLPLPGPSPDEP
jgi:MFS-type transporter involved in bile tolerance (Atg22 family)